MKALFCLISLCLLVAVSARYCGSKQTCYTALGLEPSATAKQITDAFNTLSAKYRPDVSEGLPEGGDLEKFLVISRAFEVLNSAASRKNYDEFLKNGGIDDDAPPEEENLSVEGGDDWYAEIKEEENSQLGAEKDVEATPTAFFAIFITLAITLGVPIYMQSTQKKRKFRGIRVQEGRDLSFAG